MQKTWYTSARRKSVTINCTMETVILRTETQRSLRAIGILWTPFCFATSQKLLQGCVACRKAEINVDLVPANIRTQVIISDILSDCTSVEHSCPSYSLLFTIQKRSADENVQRWLYEIFSAAWRCYLMISELDKNTLYVLHLYALEQMRDLHMFFYCCTQQNTFVHNSSRSMNGSKHIRCWLRVAFQYSGFPL